MWKTIAALLFLGTPAFVLAQPKATRLIDLAKANSPGLTAAIQSDFPQKALDEGTAWASYGPDFFFATRASSQPSLLIDGQPGPALHSIEKTNLWYAIAHIEPVAKLHSYSYQVNGAPFGGTLNLPVFGPLSYLEPGVPSGKLSAKLTSVSKIYDGMTANYWIYVPAEYDAKIPAALMVFQDGEGYAFRYEDRQILNAIDNLIAQKKIPVMICVFINPGDISGSPGTPTYKFVKAFADQWHRTLKDSMRSTLYDTVSDRYDRYLRDEILPQVAAKYNIRKDAYSRAITGGSSGGICAFNAAWQMPEMFSRVLTWVGSFTSLQWKEDPGIPDGGQDYPDKVLREPRRNIRVWLADGANDQENDRYGSWPLANLRMANALKLKGYDFHFSFATGSHNPAHGASEFPQEMIWLWRGYDPALTSETYVPDPAEKALPPFRVSITNRPANP